MAKAKELNKVSFCDFCEQYIDTVDAYNTLHIDSTNGISCEECLDDPALMVLGDIIMSWRVIG